MTDNAVTTIDATAEPVAAPDGTHLPADPMVSMIERVATDPNSDLEKLERMMEMKREHEADRAKTAFNAAFAAAVTEFPDVSMSGVNEHNKKPYATLRDIVTATRPTLSKHGLALSFSTEMSDQFVTVTAELCHAAGHTKTNSLALPRDTGPGRNAVQAVGSTQTYGQRYTAQAILGLSLGEAEDDDGNRSGNREERQRKSGDQWAATVLEDMPDNATPDQKARALTDAIIAQFGRMKGERQLMHEWDRRANIISGEKGLEERWPEMWSEVIDRYEVRMMELKAAE